MSIQTMKYVSPELKLCNTCRTSYYVWKNKNLEFGKNFSRLEEELSDVEVTVDLTRINEKTAFFSKNVPTFLLTLMRRMTLWILI